MALERKSITAGPDGHLYDVNCGKPEVPLYGHLIEGTDFTYPNTVTFICTEGYVLRGNAILRCESNGEWSGSVPRCHPTDGLFPWWAFLLGGVILLPVSAYIITKCYLLFCSARARRERELSKECDDAVMSEANMSELATRLNYDKGMDAGLTIAAEVLQRHFGR